MGRLYLEMLGGFVATPSGRRLPIRLPRRKSQALLAYLALAPVRVHARDALAALLWPEATAAEARNSLRVTLSALRAALAAARTSCLTADSESVTLDRDALETDVARFEALAARRTRPMLEEAAALYRGDLLLGLRVNEAPFEDWLTTERERLRTLALGALERLLDQQLAAGEDEAAVGSACRLLALDPLQEPVHRVLMELHARHARYGPALRQYQTCVAALHRELGVPPAIETRLLYQHILQRRAGGAAGAGQRPERRPEPTEPPTAQPEKQFASEITLVGRDPELAVVTRAAEQASGGRGSVIAILGETGIGKTRLVVEAAAMARQRGWLVLTGHAYERERGLTFGPWLDAIRSPGPRWPETLPATLDSVWRGELARLFPELGLAPAASSPDGRAALFEALGRLMEALAARTPVLLVLEDLHWADDVSASVLAFLGHRLGSLRALVLVTARDDEDDLATLRPALHSLADDAVLTRVVLAPLPQPDTARLVRALLPSGADIARVSERVWLASRGVPLVIVETVRAMQETTGPDTDGPVPLPGRVREVIEARLDRLGARARRLLDIAAVISRPFELAVLHHASELPLLEVAECVEELVRRRLFHVVGDVFDLTHDRIRQLVLDRLAPPVRHALHAAAAAAIERVYADDLEAHDLVLAGHWRQAERLDEAVRCLARVARAANARGRYPDTVAAARTAIEMLDSLPETPERLALAVDLRFALRNALLPMGDMEGVLALLRATEPLALRLGDRLRLGWLSAYMCNHLLIVGRAAEALPHGERAVIVGGEAGDRGLEVVARLHLGAALLTLGEAVATEPLFTTIMALTEDVRHERFGIAAIPAVLSRLLLACARADQGAFTDAIESGRDALWLAEELRHPYSIVQACWALARALNLQGKFAEAAAVGRHAMAVSDASPVAYIAASARAEMGLGIALSGDAAGGLAILAEACQQTRAMRVGGLAAWAFVSHALACLTADRSDTALDLARECLSEFHASGQRGMQAWMRYVSGRVAATGHPGAGDAREHFVAALALAEAMDMQPLIARCHLGLGSWLTATGDPEALGHLDRAVAMLSKMDMTYWLPSAETERSRAVPLAR